MVAVGDRIRVKSGRHNNEYTEGKVVQDQNRNGFWGVVYDDGEFGMKALNDWDIITDAPAPVETMTEHEMVIESSFVVVVNGEEMTDFADDELKAARFAIRALRLGDSALVYERKVTESFRVVDPE